MPIAASTLNCCATWSNKVQVTIASFKAKANRFCLNSKGFLLQTCLKAVSYILILKNGALILIVAYFLLYSIQMWLCANQTMTALFMKRLLTYYQQVRKNSAQFCAFLLVLFGLASLKLLPVAYIRLSARKSMIEL